MIYFKFPFDEKLYTISGTHHTPAVTFYSFDNSESLSFEGEIVEVPLEHFDKIEITRSSLPKENQKFVAETEDEYLQKLHRVIDVIQDHHLPKLVLSRRKIIRDFEHLDVKESFKNLCQAYPNAFRYVFIHEGHSWMGAFSEVLGKFNAQTQEFETMSLAGTLPISEHWSEKEIEEQKPVSAYIKDILEQHVPSTHIQEFPVSDHISGNIKHLRTDFKANVPTLEEVDQMVRELHPTPAVCGIPKDFCKENIRKFEKFSRELYAGYIKVETEDTVQYFVNLRCAKLYQDSVHLFVGGGITAQSNPKKEWEETELKSEAVLKNLVLH